MELNLDRGKHYPGIEELIGAETKRAVKGKLLDVLKNLSKEKPDYFVWNSEDKRWEIAEKLQNPNYNQLEALRNLIKVSSTNSVSENMVDRLNIYDFE